MSQIFVIQNQHGHYWGKSKEWVDGRDRRSVWRSEHKDEVVNLIFELSSKDIELRALSLEADADDSGNPIVQASSIPLQQAFDETDEDESAGEAGGAQEAAVSSAEVS